MTTAVRAMRCDRGSELCLFGADDREGILQLVDCVSAFLDACQDVSLGDVAFTLANEWSHGRPTLAIVATSVDDLRRKLKSARKRLSDLACASIQTKKGTYYIDPSRRLTGKLAFLFPGEGCQYTNMLRDLCFHYPEAREAFELADAGCGEAGFVPSELIFPTGGGAAVDGDLWDMNAAIESVTAAGMALRNVVEKLGIRPDAVVGHSSGEFVALDTARILRLEDDESTIQFIRDGYMHLDALTKRTDIPEGVLITVGGVEPPEIEAAIASHRGDLLMAVDNCPHQVVLCARPAIADSVVEHLTSLGGIVATLPFDRPYHTHWYENTLDGLRALYAAYSLHKPETPIYSCASAEPFPDDTEIIHDLCVTQWARPVRFRETIQCMYDDGIRFFVELGPRGNLTAFVNDILRDVDMVAVATDRQMGAPLQALHQAIGQLAVQGIAMDVMHLFRYAGAEALDFSARKAPAAGSSRVMTLSPIFLPRIRVSGLPRPERVGEAVPAVTVAADPPAEMAPGDPVLDAYFSTMETFLQAQDEITRHVLGGIPIDAAPSTPPATITDSRGWPLLGDRITRESESSLFAVRTFDVEDDVFLKFHTFPGTDLSIEDPGLSGLPVMPLTLSMALMAEAAAALVPGKVVVSVYDVRATRWISFEKRTRTLRIAATLRAGGSRPTVHVSIRDEGSDAGRERFAPFLAEALIDLADAYSGAMARTDPPLEGRIECNWTTGDIYPDYLFHSQLLQGIVGMQAWGSNGMIGALRVMPREGLIRSNPDPRFAYDGVLLDGTGAMLYLWSDCEGPLKNRSIVLPFRIKGVTFHAPMLPVGTTLRATLSIIGQNDMSVRANVQVMDEEGRLVMDVEEWEARVFRVDPSVHGIFHTPARHFMTEPLTFPPVTPGGPPLTGCICEVLSIDFMSSSHGVWQTVIAYSIFDRADRDTWHALSLGGDERTLWLLQRAVAKDAIRYHVRDHHGRLLASPDIKLREEGPSRFVAGGNWMAELGNPVLRVTVTHRGPVSAAVLSSGDGPGCFLEIAEGSKVTNPAAAGGEHQGDAGAVAVSSRGRRVLMRPV